MRAAVSVRSVVKTVAPLARQGAALALLRTTTETAWPWASRVSATTLPVLPVTPVTRYMVFSPSVTIFRCGAPGSSIEISDEIRSGSFSVALRAVCAGQACR